MELKDQVCSLESAKRLKEFGCKQESLFYWVEHDFGNNPNHWPGHVKPQNEFRINLSRPSGQYTDGVYQGKEQYFSAYTVAELGEMLSTCERFTIWTEYYCGVVYSRASHFTGNNIETERRIESKTEAEARAKMLIYLYENGLLQGE